MKKILFLFFLLTSRNVLSQDIDLIFDKFIDNFYGHSIRDIQVSNGLIYILGKEEKLDERSVKFYLTTVDFAGNIKSQTKIEKEPDMFLNNITKNPNSLLITGSSFMPGEDEDVQDYALLYDNDLKLLCKKKLEIKHEGNTIGLPYNDHFLIATNNNSCIIFYIIDQKGNITSKKELPTTTGGLLEGAFQLEDDKILLVWWSMTGSQGGGQSNLFILSKDLEILKHQIIPINRIDYLQNSSYPENIKPLSNENIALLWTGVPPLTMFANPNTNSIKNIEHIRHDIEFQDIENFKNNTFVYSGKLGSESAVFLINDSNIISKLTFGKMGIWSHNKIFRLSDEDYIIVSDIIRSDDFQSNVKIAKLRIK
jgi:hypothetical protein